MALTGFLVNTGNESLCLDGADAAIQALGSRFPYTAGSQPLLCNLNSSVFTAPNTFTNSVTCHDLTGNQVYTYAHPLQLMMCDPTVGNLGQHTQQEYVNAAEVIAGSLLGLWVIYWGYRQISQLLRWGRGDSE